MPRIERGAHRITPHTWVFQNPSSPKSLASRDPLPVWLLLLPRSTGRVFLRQSVRVVAALWSRPYIWSDVTNKTGRCTCAIGVPWSAFPCSGKQGSFDFELVGCFFLFFQFCLKIRSFKNLRTSKPKFVYFFKHIVIILSNIIFVFS